MDRFKDKIILITGSGRGIGKATALRFAQEGGTLIVHDAEETQELLASFEEIVAAISFNSLQHDGSFSEA